MPPRTSYELAPAGVDLQRVIDAIDALGVVSISTPSREPRDEEPTPLSADRASGDPSPRRARRRCGCSRPRADRHRDRRPSATPHHATATAGITAQRPTATANACVAPPNEPAPSGTIPANYATALAFAPDGRLFWTERSGTVRVWQNGAPRSSRRVRTVTTEPNGSYSERGLLGLAISPTFTTDRFVYAFYSDAKLHDPARDPLVRLRRHRARTPPIIATFPAGNDCCHKGGRIAFGPDGKLYVTLGDEHDAPSAQNVDDVRGKVLRYNPDGTIPSDNPFGAQQSRVGIRVPQPVRDRVLARPDSWRSR